MSSSSGNQMHVVYQTTAAFGVGLGGLVSSMTMSYTSPALPSMKKDPDFTLTESDGSWIGSVVPGFALLGSFLAGTLLDTFGRRATFLILAFPFMISWAVIATADSVQSVLLGRMLGGVCVGIQAVSGSVFIPETIQTSLRGRLIFILSFLGNMGVFVSNAAGSYLSWRGVAWFGCILCILPVVLLSFLPETPFYLTRSGKREASLASLRQLRQTAQEVEEQQKVLDETCSRDAQKEKTGFKELFTPPYRWPVLVGAALMFGQQTTGIDAVVFNASSIFEEAGDLLKASTSATLLGVVNFMGSFISMSLASRYKRGFMLGLSTSFLLVNLSILSVFFWAQEAGGWYSEVAKDFALVPVIALLTYMAGFCSGWGPVPWIYLGEGMPSQVRGRAVSFIVSISWISAFVVTKTYQWGISAVGIHYTFLCYALITCVNGTIIRRLLPETFRKSPAQMDELYLKASKIKKQ